MNYIYKTSGTCSSEIHFDIDGDVISNVSFTGGESKVKGIKCGFKNTSCGDQLAKAVREAYEAEQAQ